jgi:hypothetical protein
VSNVRYASSTLAIASVRSRCSRERPETAELLSDRMARHLKGPDRFLERSDSVDNPEPEGLAADILNGIRTFFSLG